MTVRQGLLLLTSYPGWSTFFDPMEPTRRFTHHINVSITNNKDDSFSDRAGTSKRLEIQLFRSTDYYPNDVGSFSVAMADMIDFMVTDVVDVMVADVVDCAVGVADVIDCAVGVVDLEIGVVDVVDFAMGVVDFKVGVADVTELEVAVADMVD